MSVLPARRKGANGVLENIAPVSGSTHAGLWLDRFFPAQEVRGTKVDKADKAGFYRQVAELKEPDIYTEHFETRRETLGGLAVGDVHILELCVEINGRVTTGLGAANVLENGLALHRTYGVPYLPGSGLKGLAARVARQRLDGEWKSIQLKDGRKIVGDFYRMTFGDTTEAGGVEFFDALPVPGSAKLVVDVLTPHHREYYSGEKDAPPADWDSPVPIPFLSITGQFEMALVGPQGWLELARDILLEGLRTEGFGAKTSSGYGRLEESKIQ